jgi:hypothetical protein
MGGRKNQGKQQLSASTTEWAGALASGKSIQERQTGELWINLKWSRTHNTHEIKMNDFFITIQTRLH